jgi:hypothetical protein
MFGTTPSRKFRFKKDTTAKLATANISIPFKAAGYLMDDQFISFQTNKLLTLKIIMS